MTASENTNVTVAVSPIFNAVSDNEKLETVAAVLSYVQLNCDAAVFPFEAASLNVFALTSMVVAPSPLGVNVAVYTVELDAEKFVKDPPETLTSPTTKSVVASLDVNVSAIKLSFDASPSETVEEVIAIVGGVLSPNSAVATNCKINFCPPVQKLLTEEWAE